MGTGYSRRRWRGSKQVLEQIDAVKTYGHGRVRQGSSDTFRNTSIRCNVVQIILVAGKPLGEEPSESTGTGGESLNQIRPVSLVVAAL